jgi:hypothetical protein
MRSVLPHLVSPFLVCLSTLTYGCSSGNDDDDGGGGGGTGGGSSTPTTGTIAVTLDSSSTSQTAEFVDAEISCSYSGNPIIGLVIKTDPGKEVSLLTGIDGLFPHTQVHTYNPNTVLNGLFFQLQLEGYAYEFFHDQTTWSSCSTNLEDLSETHAKGSTTCTSLIPTTDSADYTGDLLNPGPHGTGSITFDCTIE